MNLCAPLDGWCPFAGLQPNIHDEAFDGGLCAMSTRWTSHPAWGWTFGGVSHPAPGDCAGRSRGRRCPTVMAGVPMDLGSVAGTLCMLGGVALERPGLVELGQRFMASTVADIVDELARDLARGDT